MFFANMCSVLCGSGGPPRKACNQGLYTCIYVTCIASFFCTIMFQRSDDVLTKSVFLSSTGQRGNELVVCWEIALSGLLSLSQAVNMCDVLLCISCSLYYFCMHCYPFFSYMYIVLCDNFH